MTQQRPSVLQMPTTEREKVELVNLCRQVWGDEVAQLLAEDLGLAPAPANDRSESVH